MAADPDAQPAAADDVDGAMWVAVPQLRSIHSEWRGRRWQQGQRCSAVGGRQPHQCSGRGVLSSTCMRWQHRRQRALCMLLAALVAAAVPAAADLTKNCARLAEEAVGRFDLSG